MLITRSEARLVFTAGLATGFGALTAMPFNYYLGLTVLAINTGSYGGVLGLGRQRLLGSLLGAVVLGVALPALKALPMPLALGLALAALRLLGGLLQLQAGYKVGAMIVVMGWLVHDNQLGEWLHLRLFWTVLGTIVALASLRLFWPASAVLTCWRELAGLVDDLAASVQTLADRLQGPGRAMAAERPAQRRQIMALRARLARVRALRPQVREELGTLPHDHPIERLLDRLDGTCSRLIAVVQGLEAGRSRLPHPEPGSLPPAEAALLAAVAERLRTWRGELLQVEGRRQALPPSPSQPLIWPDPWRAIDPWLQSSSLDGMALEPLQQLAGRLVLCRQAQQLIERTEDLWREPVHG